MVIAVADGAREGRGGGGGSLTRVPAHGRHRTASVEAMAAEEVHPLASHRGGGAIAWLRSSMGTTGAHAAMVRAIRGCISIKTDSTSLVRRHCSRSEGAGDGAENGSSVRKRHRSSGTKRHTAVSGRAEGWTRMIGGAGCSKMCGSSRWIGEDGSHLGIDLVVTIAKIAHGVAEAGGVM